MTSQSSAASRPTTFPNRPSSKTNRAFFGVLFTIALVLLTAGIGAFGYLVANGPLALRSQGDRPIALATAFVPADAPFAFSLLTNPDNIVAQQQALPNANPQEVLETARQIEQSFFKDSPIDYDRDIRPWLGDEITIACTTSDLDFDEANGRQPGYLLAFEIAPGRSQQAKESLQIFWQRQSLAGSSPQSEQLSGVRLLSIAATRSKKIGLKAAQDRAIAGQFLPMGAATALVGNQFVLFANDAQVIRQSLRATETAANLAQSRPYRTAAGKLPLERLGLAHLSTVALKEFELERPSPQGFTTVGLKLAQTGVAVTALLPESTFSGSAINSSQSVKELTPLLKFIPPESAIAFVSQNLSQLEPTIAATGLPIALPDFLVPPPNSSEENSDQTVQSPWQWAKGDYAIAQTQSDKADWILVVERTADGVAKMDEFARSQGYSATPLTLGGQKATAWTKLKTRSQRSRSSSTLETELLGLHLQPKHLLNEDSLDNDLLDDDSLSGYEIFASSITAMNSALGALNAPSSSLSGSPKFISSAAENLNHTDSNQEGYLYMDWAAIAPILAQSPIVNNVASALRPITRQIDHLTANKSGDTLNLFIRFKQSQSKNQSKSQSE